MSELERKLREAQKATQDTAATASRALERLQFAEKIVDLADEFMKSPRFKAETWDALQAAIEHYNTKVRAS